MEKPGKGATMRLEGLTGDHTVRQHPLGGFIRGIDARAKLVFAALCGVIAIASGGPVAPVFIGAVCLLLLAVSGAGLRTVLFRLSEPLVFAGVIAAFQVFLVGGEAVWGLRLFGLELTASDAGLARGVAIFSRVFGAVSVVLFLTMTTPVNRLLSAAAWFKAPKGLVELSLFAYRYVFVLIEDAVTVYHAQKGRLGYSGLMLGAGSLGTLCGAVFLRAFDQAEATGAAMAQRGYTGSYVPDMGERFRASDALFLGSLAAVCLAVDIWTL